MFFFGGGEVLTGGPVNRGLGPAPSQRPDRIEEMPIDSHAGHSVATGRCLERNSLEQCPHNLGHFAPQVAPKRVNGKFTV